MTGLVFASDTAEVLPLFLISKDGLSDWLGGLSPQQRRWAKAAGFKANAGQVLLFADEDGSVVSAAGGLGGAKDRARGRFLAASLRSKLPEGNWAFATEASAEDLTEAALGWLLAGYSFNRYAKKSASKAMLVPPSGVDAARIEQIAAGEAFARDLINTPASDMGQTSWKPPLSLWPRL